jgi:hypothetical protein
MYNKKAMAKRRQKNFFSTEKQDKNPLTQPQMVEMAQLAIGKTKKTDEAGYINPCLAHWTHKADYSIAHVRTLMDNLGDWQTWFTQAQHNIIDPLESIRFQQLLDEPTDHPVILSIIEGKLYVWAGWDRIAAAVISKRANLPAIIATKEAMHSIFPFNNFAQAISA